MAERRSRIVYRPLDGWSYPETRQQPTPFSSPWSSTTDLLRREADHLHCRIIVVELDVPARAIRLDDDLRADARAASEKVRITMETASRGTLSWHTDLYRLPNRGALGWRENVRAIALTLESLRAVERYGAVHSSEQYRGFTAIEAAREAGSFSSPEDALRWLQSEVGLEIAGHEAWRVLARDMHPDAGGDPGDWARLDEAKRLLEGTDLW